MKTSIFTFISLLAVIAALAAAPAQRGKARGVFERVDKNGDGKVTPDELPNAETFARFDLNKDGVISLDEDRQVLGGAAPSTATPETPGDPRVEQMFQAFDRNGDGVLAKDEWPAQFKRAAYL
nr:EF-hand domain-containing protein [Verrucomicrobiota bacterium]